MCDISIISMQNSWMKLLSWNFPQNRICYATKFGGGPEEGEREGMLGNDLGER